MLMQTCCLYKLAAITVYESGWVKNKAFWVTKLSSQHVRPRQGTEIFNFGEFSPVVSLNYLQLIFPFSPGFLRSLVRKLHQNVEKLPDFRKEKKE